MKHYHLIGIGGAGLSAIARILLDLGYTVTGSDRAESPFMRDLRAGGVTISLGHSAENVSGADAVIRSSAIPDDNTEVVAAVERGIPVYKRSDFLASLMEGKTVVAVAGTHGKTTTTSMIAWMLSDLNQDPSFIVGGVLSNLGVNARAGEGDVFVIEADEYDRMFLGLKPTIAVVTNVEHDHPDCYPTPEEYQAAFVDFVKLLPSDGSLVTCGEDAGARQLAQAAEKLGKAAIRYGVKPALEDGQEMDVYTTVLTPNTKGGFTFSAQVLGSAVTVNLEVPGRHNVANALAALTAAQLLGLPLAGAARALSQFHGSGRRFDVRGEAAGVTIVDDYAHHPTEIRATLSAARARYPGRRLLAVWQPHTYSRTRSLFDDFVQAFDDADEVLVTEIYAAREPAQDFSSRQIVEAMARPAHYFKDLQETSHYLLANLRSGDVLVVCSAGDADQISTTVLTRLKEVRNG